MDINLLENTWYFKLLTLEKWETLFNEWDIDTNLYIVKKWKLSIEKFITVDRCETKQLAILKQDSIFWEWSLSNSDPKQVRIVALENTEVIKIDTDKDFEDFMKKYTKEWIMLLSWIIDTTNHRLLESNFLVTSIYQISKSIANIEEYNNKNLFKIIDEFNQIIWAKYIIYIEKNPVINDYVNIKYDSRNSWRMQSTIIELNKDWLDLEKIELEWIPLWKNNLIKELKSSNNNIWYLIIWEWEKEFDKWQQKSISSISVLISWFIKQKQHFEEIKNLEYSKNN